MNIDIESGDSLGQTVDTHLARSHDIGRMAEVFANKMCDGGSFIALHWRNRSGEICETSSSNHSSCNKVMDNLRKAVVHLTEVVVKYMNNNSFQCLYVAHPPHSERIVSYLSPMIPRVYSSTDLVAEGVVQDEFYTSLVEQEICSRAEVFFSCNNCAWSQPVRADRKNSGKSTMFVSDLPGLNPMYTILM
ncbi:uncharacterized protein LOC144446385 [Glandiceps talaboti]